MLPCNKTKAQKRRWLAPIRFCAVHPREGRQVERLDRVDGVPLGGVTQPRCEKCRRFARLLPGETQCARCSGVLALEFSEITTPSDAIVRGGW